MNRLNPDGHDQSQYLPKKWFNPKTGKEEDYPIINKWRMEKGDIKRNADDKLEAATWMPRILFLTLNENGKPYLEADYVHTCERIERAANSAMAALGLSTLRMFVIGATEYTALKETDPFTKLLTQLLPYQSNLLLWLISDERNRGNIALAKQMISSIHNALDLAKKILDEA